MNEIKISEQICVKIIPALGIYIHDNFQDKDMAITKEEIFSLIIALQHANAELCEEQK